MDHVYTLLMLIVPCSVLCIHVPAPINLTMDSFHFIHLLTWQAGPGSPVGLHYRVIVRSYKEDWKTVDSCDAVRSPLLCNLTDIFSNLDETYYISVTAVLGNKTSTPCSYRPFKPVSDTVLELPSLQVSQCNRSLCVYLQSPSERLHMAYKKFHYMLNVTNEKGDQFIRNTRGLDTVDLEVVPGVQYCVSVNITGRRSAPKPPVCASKPAAVSNMDAVISVVLCLLALIIVIIVGLLVLKSSINLKTRQPLVLSSFKVPYKVQLLPWPTVESLKCISLEPNMYKDVQVNEDVDKETEGEEVAYMRRKGCEEVEISEEHTPNPVTETYAHAPDMITHHWDSTAPQTASHILTTNHFPLKTPIQELKKNDLVLLGHKTGDEVKQEEEEDDKEDNDSVNFFSLTMGGQSSDQQEETDKEEKMENGKKVKPEISLFVFESPKLVMDIQPVYSESTNKCISYFVEKEDEDTEEEEAFSAYMMRS